MDYYNLCKQPECWCQATVLNSTYIKLPYSIIDDIVENGFINVLSLDFIMKAFEASV